MRCKYKGTGVWEGRCTGTKEVDPCVGQDKCPRFKPACTTNGDRIRAMTDEELARWLTKTQRIGDAEVFRDGYYQLWLDWLKEATDGKQD